MGEHQAWITFNLGYSEIAEADSRHHVLKVRLPFHNPTEHGLPPNEEYPQLQDVDEALDEEISSAGGVYVGRLTVDGHRYFYFYVGFPESQASDIVRRVATLTRYRLQYVYELDEEKTNYWNELYPTVDDWQVIKDLDVLDRLAEHGDVKERKREVMHWAYLPNEVVGREFADWAKSEHYVVHFSGKEEDGSEWLTQYSHVGTMTLADITSHTIKSNRKARELGGRYDGWETSIEKQ
ncbi:hypothetical protein F0521_21260 [Ferrimonas sp. YFM]|nr:hypothetical protein F0521_21260 [Ferrimonas sp. YFM]